MSRTVSKFSIPNSYNELEQQYGAFIKHVIRKKNKKKDNFDDIWAEIWVKLLEAKFLERFKEHVQAQTPKVMSVLDVCDFLGISWNQWRGAMDRSQKGKKYWMPTPINLAEFQMRGYTGGCSKKALFSFEDIISLTLEKHILKRGKVRPIFYRMGQEVKDGIVIGKERPEGYLKFPEIKATASLFKNYLKRSTLNHLANFCRTKKRRHKEEVQNPPLAEKEIPWEATLQDTKSTPIDVYAELTDAKRLLYNTIRKCAAGFRLYRPVEEHTAEVVTFLQNGVGLMQALQETKLPHRVCKSVFATMSSC